VSTEAPFGGGVFIADTSAWNRADRLPPAIKREWERALVNDQIAASPPITLEILYSAQGLPSFNQWVSRLRALRRLATIDRDSYWATVEGYREICAQGWHRSIPFADLMAAGAATSRHWGVLHYDGHFDRLASLNAFDFESRWIAPNGSIP
jgi:predicted nucleic acid-binding protein